MKSVRKVLLGSAALCAFVAASSAHAFCGFYAGKADASLFNEASQVVVARDGSRTVLSMLNDYNGPLSEFVLVVPTPVPLKQGQVRIADKAVFEHLDAYSSPRLAEYNDDDPCRVDFTWGQQSNLYSRSNAIAYAPAPAMMKAEARDKVLGVTVEARYTLEEYDIVSLSAKQSDGLETWLRENGYKIPKGTSEALRPYINQGMKFFVAKVNLKEQLKTGYSRLRPLQFAFESEKFMLPMRLGMLNAPPGKAQDLIVYLMTRNGRVESSNYRTAKLPANVNLPDFVKPKFQDFYKAMFDKATRTEDYRVDFTEYFWNMGWCDPCAAQPLARDELMKAGVFWLDGDASQNFNTMQNPSALVTPMRRFGGGQAQPVMLTRLHVRYTPRTFPEDLMFTQTSDSENWQARYVIQNPYAGSVSECVARTAQMNCELMCQERIPQVRESLRETDPQSIPPEYRSNKPPALWGDCLNACRAAKSEGVQAAVRYYRSELPQRIASEKQTLVQLTGWSLHEIDAMPGAQRFAATGFEGNVGGIAAPSEQSWWQKLFAQ